MKRIALLAAAVAATLGAVLAPGSAAASPAFSGSCQFSGPITPVPAITLIPLPGPHFSYEGTGTCTGGLPITVTFKNVATLFDTCELGPDFGLHGLATIGGQNLHITVNLARLAIAGPFVLTTPHHGLALGIAQFTTANPTDCISPGVASATLTGSFQTVRPLR